MYRDFPDFCHRQSTKMIEYAKSCIDPVLKDEFLKMSAYWLKSTSRPQVGPPGNLYSKAGPTRLLA
jgi:hypothetical protein